MVGAILMRLPPAAAAALPGASPSLIPWPDGPESADADADADADAAIQLPVEYILGKMADRERK